MLYKCKFHFHDDITGDIFGVSCNVNASSVADAVGKAVMKHRQEDHYSVWLSTYLDGGYRVTSGGTYSIEVDDLNLCAKPIGDVLVQEKNK